MNNVSPHTRFYRDAPQLEALAAAMPARAKPRLLSAGCSTGEEVYTLAMMLPTSEVVGIDIDPNNIATARKGEYPGAELPPRLKKYLNNDVIDPAVAARCRFQHADLLKTGLFGPFDAILCRNVIIYLAEDDALSLLDRLARALSPEGLLFVARAEIQLARKVAALQAFDLADDVVAFRRATTPG
jgi:chemotaxis protein methyltransferase CheR